MGRANPILSTHPDRAHFGVFETVQCQSAPPCHVLFEGKVFYFIFFDIFFGMKPIKKRQFTAFSHFFPRCFIFSRQNNMSKHY